MQQHGPSPTKRTAFEPVVAPPQLPVDSLRGKFQREASTGFEDVIKSRAQQARYSVSQGFQAGTLPSTASANPRSLRAYQTEPNLSFQGSAWLSNNSAPFVTSRDVLESVYSPGGSRRGNELQPMYETGSPSPSPAAGGAFGRSASWSASEVATTGGYQTRETTTDFGMDTEGDGFDPDEVFGNTKNFSFTGQKLNYGQEEDSQNSNSTITAKMKKRTFDDAEDDSQGITADDDDDRMVLTEPEDEVEDKVPGLNMFGNGNRSPRKLGARRTLGKTQSLPASVFKSEMF